LVFDSDGPLVTGPDESMAFCDVASSQVRPTTANTVDLTEALEDWMQPDELGTMRDDEEVVEPRSHGRRAAVSFEKQHEGQKAAGLEGSELGAVPGGPAAGTRRGWARQRSRQSELGEDFVDESDPDAIAEPASKTRRRRKRATATEKKPPPPAEGEITKPPPTGLQTEKAKAADGELQDLGGEVPLPLVAEPACETKVGEAPVGEPERAPLVTEGDSGEAAPKRRIRGMKKAVEESEAEGDERVGPMVAAARRKRTRKLVRPEVVTQGSALIDDPK
jgi:hypothetical protein